MSDIQKLHKVIESLEEQSSTVNEFNGVLVAINLAKAEIASAKEAFSQLGDEQQKLVTNSYTKFDEYGKKLSVLAGRLSALEATMVTAEQFESGRNKILLRTSELRFVSPEQFEKDIAKLEKNMGSLITESNSYMQKLLETQQSAIKSLKTIMMLGMMVLAGGVAFLAKDAFISAWTALV